MLSRSVQSTIARSSIRPSTIAKNSAGASRRTYATTTSEGHTGKGGSVPPFQPRKAFSPYLLAGGAVALIVGWYQISKKDPPKTPQVSGIEKALQPKIDANRDGGVAPGESKVTKRISS